MSGPAAGPAESRGSAAWPPLAATALVLVESALKPSWPVLTPAALILLLVAWRRVSKPLALLALAAAALEGAAATHLRVEARLGPGMTQARLEARLGLVERRARELLGQLDASAARVASLPAARDALAGDRRALSRLFQQLGELRSELAEHAAPRERPALAVHALPLSTIAWAGRVADLRAFQGIAGTHRDVFILAGSVTTTLVATVPIRAPDGQLAGLASAELAVAVRRNIRNEFLSDIDLLTSKDPALDVHYVDARYEAQGPRPFPALPPGVLGREALLRAPDGGLLAAVRASAPAGAGETQSLESLYRRLLSALACLVFGAWIAGAGGTAGPRVRLAVGATALRLALLALGPPIPAPPSRLLSPDIYASTLLGAPARLLAQALALPWLQAVAGRPLEPLLRSPLDLLLTVAWVLVLVALASERALSAHRASSNVRALGSFVLALPVLGAVFAWIADTSANCSLDIEALPLLPGSASQLAIQVGLLLLLASGVLAIAAVLALGGPFPEARRERLGRLAGAGLVAALAYRLWPRGLLGLPLVPAVLLFLLAAALAGTAPACHEAIRRASSGVRAGLALLATAALSLLLYPALVHYREKDLRQQIERDQAPLVLRQPQWRSYVLAETEHKIDALHLLEDAPGTPIPPLLEEMAFAVWSTTDLAAFGFSSAVEIQDAAGTVVSRFALNLPSLSGPSQPLPTGPAWRTVRETLPVASGGGQVLHASRLLSSPGGVRGAVHVYVKDDFWNLPFVRGRDPYSVLYRTAPLGTVKDRPVVLLAYDWSRALLFSSADQPPALDAGLLARLSDGGPGLWTTLPVDGQLHHTYLFADSHGIYGLAYPRLAAGHFAADLVEAGAGMTLLALAGLLAVLLVRALLGKRTLSLLSLWETVQGRFSLRLFVAFIGLAVVPVATLDVVVREFVAERLRAEAEADALERAAVAKKAVEDFVLFRRGETRGSQPGLDAGLVYIASLMRSDLDVFQQGRLLASSKRELYASGLLPSRVPGSVYRALVLEGQPSAIGTERIGGFSYLVVSVPVRLDGAEPGILSIPLALRQREIEDVLEDLDRTIRLASLLFLVGAAALAHSVARRISGPVHDLTLATQRVAHGDLSARVATSSRDELRALVESFNQMARDLDRQRGELERSNRLAAWAEVARQVAHEVKNPLTPIQLSAEHLRRVHDDPQVDFAATLRTCTETILKQVRILRGIVTEFSALARPPAPRLERHDPAAILAELLQPYQSVLPPAVRLSLEVSDGVPPVPVDRRLLERAVVNLIENALQAVGESGSIAVRLRPGGDRVELEVEDSGPGVDAELRERVFEPFFSTKTGGTGLGLALVKKIAEDHGGGVTLESGPAGTRVRLWLPLEPKAGADSSA